MIKFVNEEHEINFKILLKRDKTFKGDFYRLPFLYLLSTDLTFYKVDDIYDFEEGVIRDFDIVNSVDFSSSARMLVKLAINIFNGHNYQDSIVDIFSVLDDDRHIIALKAIDMRMRCYNYKKAIDEFYNKYNLNHTPIRYY